MTQINPVVLELSSRKEMQRVKYWASYSASAIILNGGSANMLITIEQDAAFEIMEATMRARGPVEPDGRPIGSSPAYAGETGVTDFPTFGVTTAASGGLSFTLTDTGAGRVLINNEVDLELVGTPGYGQQLYIPFKLKYMALQNTKLLFDIRNRDLATTAPGGLDQYHSVEIALWGYKYESYLGV